jgi:hypothetical protein
VLLRVRLGGFLGVVLGMDLMTVRGMRMLCRVVVCARVVMFCRFPMMLRGMFVVFRRLLVMVGDAGPVRHFDAPL